MISALCARAWGSLVFLLCFASFSVGELSTSILVWFSGCNPHLVVALQVVVSAERCWECWTPALETSYGYGVGWSWWRLWDTCFVETCKEKSAFPLRRHLAMFTRNGSPSSTQIASSKCPCPVAFVVELQKQSHQDSFSWVSVHGDVFRLYLFLNTVGKHHHLLLIPCNFNCGAHHTGAWGMAG